MIFKKLFMEFWIISTTVSQMTGSYNMEQIQIYFRCSPHLKNFRLALDSSKCVILNRRRTVLKRVWLSCCYEAKNKRQIREVVKTACLKKFASQQEICIGGACVQGKGGGLVTIWTPFPNLETHHQPLKNLEILHLCTTWTPLAILLDQHIVCGCRAYDVQNRYCIDILKMFRSIPFTFSFSSSTFQEMHHRIDLVPRIANALSYIF